MTASSNKNGIHLRAAIVLVLACSYQTLGFLSNSIRAQRHRSLTFTQGNNEIESFTSEIFQDEFASLVESHPLDDPEPSPTSSPQQQQQESNISMVPTEPEEEWKWFYSKLKERNSNQEAPLSSKNSIMEEFLLRHWMAQQRKAFMKTLGVLDLHDKANWGTPFLSRQQKQLLDQVKFPWGHLQPSSLTNDIVYSEDFQRRVRLDYKDWQWNGWYERLCNFAQQHGHCRVPIDDDDHAELAKWAAEQRSLRRTMPKRRRKRLDELQFDWNWKDTSASDADAQAEYKVEKDKEVQQSSQRGSFGRRVKELKEFRRANGNCNVPLDYPGGLGEWVERIKGRRSSLSPSSIQKLEMLGLVFTTEVEGEE